MDLKKLDINSIDKICKQRRKDGVVCGIIYCYTNIVSGKKYVGQTHMPKVRHYFHKKHSLRCNDRFVRDQEQLIHLAMNKYGLDNFSYEVLEIIEGEDKVELKKLLNKAENKWIVELKSFKGENGYNMTFGGDGMPIGKNHPNSKSVDCYSIDGTFLKTYESISQAAMETGACEACVSKCCKRISEIANRKYRFTFHGEDLAPLIDKKHGKTVYVYAYDGSYERSFDSISEAAEFYNISITTVSDCANGKHETRKSIGHRFSFEKSNNIGKSPLLDTRIYQYNPDGSFSREFDSMAAASRFYGLKSCMSFIEALKYDHRKAKGYYFRRYKTDNIFNNDR